MITGQRDSQKERRVWHILFSEADAALDGISEELKELAQQYAVHSGDVDLSPKQKELAYKIRRKIESVAKELEDLSQTPWE